MKKTNASFLIKSFIVFISLVVTAFVLQTNFSPSSTRWYLFIVPLVAFLINFASYTVSTGNMAKRNFGTLLSALFIIKFFAYTILAIIYFLLEKSKLQRLVFIAFIFLVYTFNLVVLLNEVLKYQKSISKKEENSK